MVKQLQSKAKKTNRRKWQFQHIKARKKRKWQNNYRKKAYTQNMYIHRKYDKFIS